MATNPLLRYGPPRQINCTLGISGEFPNYTSGSAYTGTVSIAGAQGATTVALVPPGTDASGTAYVPLVNADFGAGASNWTITAERVASTFSFQAGAGRTAAGFLRWAPAGAAPNDYFGDTIGNGTVVQSNGTEVNLQAWIRCTAIGPTPSGEYIDVLLGVQIYDDAAATIPFETFWQAFTIGGAGGGSRRISSIMDWFPLFTRLTVPAGKFYRLAFQLRAGTSGTIEMDDCQWDARGVPSGPASTLGLPAGFTIDTVTSPDRVRVQWPATATPGTSTLPNLGMETGDVNWLKGAGWTISTGGLVDAGTWSAKYNGVGQSNIVHETMAPVAPGTTITASCRISKGNNRQDFAGGAVLLQWFDANTRIISFNVGNVVNTGSSAFQTSSVTATAPAGAAFVRLGASGTRDVKGRASDIIAVDTFAWNHTFALGGSGGGGGTATPTTGPVSLTFRVTDSVGCSAVATRVIEQATANPTALSIYNKIREWFTFDTVGATVTGNHAGAVLTVKTAFGGTGTRSAVASPKTNGVTFTGRDVGGAGLGQGFGTDYGGAGNAGQQENVSIAAICRRRTGASSASNFSDIALCMGTTFTSGAATEVIGIGRNSGSWAITYGEGTAGTTTLNAGTIVNDTWQLVVGTFTYSGSSNGTARGYLNGTQAVPAGQGLAGTRTRAAATAAYTVGGILARTSSEFRNPTHDLVDFDEVAFFNGVLTQTEIDYLHNGGSFRSYQEIKTAAGF